MRGHYTLAKATNKSCLHKYFQMLQRSSNNLIFRPVAFANIRQYENTVSLFHRSFIRWNADAELSIKYNNLHEVFEYFRSEQQSETKPTSAFDNIRISNRLNYLFCFEVVSNSSGTFAVSISPRHRLSMHSIYVVIFSHFRTFSRNTIKLNGNKRALIHKFCIP